MNDVGSDPDPLDLFTLECAGPDPSNGAAARLKQGGAHWSMPRREESRALVIVVE